MCALRDLLEKRLAIMLPSEELRLTQATLRELLATCDCGASLKPAPDACTDDGPRARATWSVEDLAARLRLGASTLRERIAKGMLGDPAAFRGSGRGFVIPGALAEQLIAHVHAGRKLPEFDPAGTRAVPHAAPPGLPSPCDDAHDAPVPSDRVIAPAAIARGAAQSGASMSRPPAPRSAAPNVAASPSVRRRQRGWGPANDDLGSWRSVIRSAPPR